jgi:hypothetical protein
MENNSVVQQALAELRNEISPALKVFHVASVEAAYTRCQDSRRTIDGMQFRDVSGRRVDRNSIPVTLMKALESRVITFIPNAEGQGTVTVDLVGRVVTLRHCSDDTASGDLTKQWNA